MTWLICSICAKPIRCPLSWDSQASINNVTSWAESDLKPISQLASKRVIAGKSSVPHSHIPSTNNSVCVEQPNNCFLFYLWLFLSSLQSCACNTPYHFFTGAVTLASWNDSVLSFLHVSWVHILTHTELRDRNAEPQIRRGYKMFCCIDDSREKIILRWEEQLGLFPAPLPIQHRSTKPWTAGDQHRYQLINILLL